MSRNRIGKFRDEEMTEEEQKWLRLWHIAPVCPCCCHEGGGVQSGDAFDEPCERDFVTKNGKVADLYWCGSCGSAWSIRINKDGKEILHIEPDEEV